MAGYFLIFCCLSRRKSGQNSVLYWRYLSSIKDYAPVFSW